MSKYSFLLDVDGVMTTGQFLYSIDGKAYKIFGPHDADGLKLVRDKVNISFISADRRGFDISKRRIVNDMGYKLDLVGESERFKYVQSNYNLGQLFYMGDGYFDAPILKACFYGIAPKNARIEARKSANYVTESDSGKGAVLDAALKILQILQKIPLKKNRIEP